MSSALAQAQDHVGPALAARRAVIEFAEQGAMLGEVGIFLADAAGGEPVEHAELALAQPLVDDRLARRLGRPRPPRRSPWRSGGRGHKARRARLRACSASGSAANQRPSAAACSWPSSLSGTSTSRIGDVDRRRGPAACGGVARDIAGALPVADDPELFGPSLSHGRNKARARRKGSEQAFGLQPRAQVRGVGEQMRLHADRPRAVDVDLRGRR